MGNLPSAPMDEAPSWAPKARRYEICEALGVDPWAGRVTALGIEFLDEQCVIDYHAVQPLTLKKMLGLSSLFNSSRIELDVDLGHDDYDNQRSFYAGHYRIIIKPDEVLGAKAR